MLKHTHAHAQAHACLQVDHPSTRQQRTPRQCPHHNQPGKVLRPLSNLSKTVQPERQTPSSRESTHLHWHMHCGSCCDTAVYSCVLSAQCSLQGPTLKLAVGRTHTHNAHTHNTRSSKQVSASVRPPRHRPKQANHGAVPRQPRRAQLPVDTLPHTSLTQTD